MSEKTTAPGLARQRTAPRRELLLPPALSANPLLTTGQRPCLLAEGKRWRSSQEGTCFGRCKTHRQRELFEHAVRSELHCAALTESIGARPCIVWLSRVRSRFLRLSFARSGPASLHSPERKRWHSSQEGTFFGRLKTHRQQEFFEQDVRSELHWGALTESIGCEHRCVWFRVASPVSPRAKLCTLRASVPAFSGTQTLAFL